MTSFLDSNLFQTIITLLVGLSAYIIYRWQLADKKRDAARGILLEVQNAERTVNKVRASLRNNQLEIDLTVMQSESWSKNKSLFVRDFDTDEWDMLDNFYNRCALLDKAIIYNSIAFANDVEQIRTNKQRVLADCVKEMLDNFKVGDKPDEFIKTFNEKVKIFDQIYMSKQVEFAYHPQKPLDDAKLYLEDLPKITTSSVGIKLKKLAGISK